jgi:hypothetical protein
MEGAVTAIRLIPLAAASLVTAARACNEECTTGFVFDDAEGVCVRGDPVST